MLTQPESTENCVYFTRRSHEKGIVIAWAPRGICAKCGKSFMGKPTDKKGKIKIRAKEYTCKDCGFTQEKNSYEDSLTANVIYDCPSCSKHGEIQLPFKRKKVRITDKEDMKTKTVDVLRFACGFCKQNIDISKKMK
ncbi:MAG: hypothetical protein Q7K43_05740 [Candidatus Woesearchaeota archaeon]|nr:hypothetical protein [Candidatus Woesearchaeota archaeon]